MPTIQQLNTRNVNTDLDHIDNLRVLAEGGPRLRKKVREFLKQRPGETAELYELRCAELTYQNFLGTCVDFTSANLFASKPEPVARLGNDANANPGAWWSGFLANVDGNSTDFNDFMEGRFHEALVSGVSYIRLHAPTPNAATPPQNAAEWAADGLDAVRLEALDAEDVIDWTNDRSGQLIWALTFKREQPRLGLRAETRVTDTWTELTDREIVTYAITYDPKYPPSPDQEVPIVSSTTQTWGVVPLVVVQVPPALWIANKLEIPCRSHLRLLNGHQFNLLSSCFATPVFKLRNPNNTPSQLGAGYGMALGEGEDFSWAAPPSAHMTVTQHELASTRTEIFRQAFQLALGIDGTATAAVQRSAESKIQDSQSSKVMIGRFAKVARESCQRVLELVSAYRGDGFKWTVSGLRDMTPADLYALIDALERVEKMGGVPSDTAKTELWRMVADGLLQGVPQATRATIHDEIAVGVANALTPAEVETQQVIAMQRALHSHANDAA